MHYLDADEEYFSIVDEYSHDVFPKLLSTEFPQTYRAMFMFCAKTNNLKAGMFECIDSDNPYSFKVLFRCFCEHYLKFMYVWTRFLSEMSDAVGVEYYSFCGASEARDYVSAIAMAEGLFGNSTVPLSIHAALAAEGCTHGRPNSEDCLSMLKKEEARLMVFM